MVSDLLYSVNRERPKLIERENHHRDLMIALGAVAVAFTLCFLFSCHVDAQLQMDDGTMVGRADITYCSR